MPLGPAGPDRGGAGPGGSVLPGGLRQWRAIVCVLLILPVLVAHARGAAATSPATRAQHRQVLVIGDDTPRGRAELELARQAAELAVAALAGRLRGKEPIIQQGPSRPIFDYRQLERFGVPLGALPPDRILLNQPRSASQEYETLIWMAAGGLILLAGAVALMTISFIKRRRAEQALHGQQRLFGSILAHIPHSVFWKDTNLAYLGCNENFARDAGLARPEDVVGRTDLDLPWPPEQAEVRRQADREVLRTGRAILNMEEVRRLADGRETTVLTSKVPLRDGAGKVIGVLGIYIDITERKKAAEEQAHLEAMLAHSQKMEAIGQLAGGIAHDFNNLLTVIQGNAELLRLGLDGEGDAQRRELTESVIAAARRAAELTGQLLAFARRDRLQTVPVNLHDTVGQIVRLLEHSLDKRIEVRQALASAAPVVEGDPAQLQAALLNLALNARDAMAEGGTITFASRDRDVDEALARARCPDLAPGPYVELSVGDTGVGMDEQTARRAFEPFFTTKEVGKGTGLGLSIVYGCAKAHHGAVLLDSAPGAGTTVRILLSRFAMGGAAAALPAGQAIARGTGHILVADDEQAVRDFCTRALEDLGYTVTACIGGAEAVELYRRRRDEIDLVLLDRVMPGMDGQAALRKLREFDPQVRVVLFSGLARPNGSDGLPADGALEFLAKPFDIPQLSQAVARHIRRKVVDGGCGAR